MIGSLAKNLISMTHAFTSDRGVVLAIDWTYLLSGSGYTCCTDYSRRKQCCRSPSGRLTIGVALEYSGVPAA
jgi:hypothetical protein